MKTEIDRANMMIRDALGLWWTFKPAFNGFGHDRIVCEGDTSEDGGYPCIGFREAVEELLDGGYLDEEYARGWLEAN